MYKNVRQLMNVVLLQGAISPVLVIVIMSQALLLITDMHKCFYLYPPTNI